MHLISRIFALSTAALLAASGCGGGGSGGATTESPDLGASTEMLVTAADGGEVELAEAGIKLSIPAGALAADEMITAEVISKSGLAGSNSLLGNVVEFGPDGLEFAMPVTLELDLKGATVPDDAEVSIAFYDEEAEEWIDLGGSRLEDGKVVAETTHFTIFAVRFVVNSDGEIVQEGGACGADYEPCGGNLEGTWTIASGCANVPSLGNAGGQCAGASLSLGMDITGDIVIDATTITGTLNLTSEFTQIIPKSCVGGMCPDSDPADEDDFVFVDMGDTCEGTQTATEVEELNETYAVDGNMIVMSSEDASSDPEDGETTTFCVSGNTLVVNTVNAEGVEIRWTATRR